MSKKRTNWLLVVAAFLAGAAIAAIAVFFILGQGASGKTDHAGPTGKNIDYAAVFPSWEPDSASL